MAIQNITGMPTSRLQSVGTGKASSPQTGAPQGNSSAASSSVAGDRVSLTSSAENMKQIESKIASMPAVDTARVESVKGAINSGSYEIDPGQVADSIISFEAQLYGQS